LYLLIFQKIINNSKPLCFLMSGLDELEEDINRAKQEEKQIREEEQETEGEISELANEERQVDQAEGAVEGELKEGEQTGNVEEIEDAEEKMQKVLVGMRDEEKIADDIIEHVERELKLEEDVAKKLYSDEELLKEIFDSWYSNLNEDIQRIAQTEAGSNPKVYSKILKLIFGTEYGSLSNLVQASIDLDELLKALYRLEEELEETEAEEFKLEKLETRMADEIEKGTHGVEHIEEDSKKIKSKKDLKLAETEVQEISGLTRHWKEEEAEMEKIDKKIEEEVKEVETEIEEVKGLIGELGEIIKLINGLETEIKQNKKQINYALSNYSSNTGISINIENVDAKGILGELEKYKQKLQNIYGKEVSEEKQLESKASKLEEGATKAEKGVSALRKHSPSAEQAARASVSSMKWVTVIVILLLIFVALMWFTTFSFTSSNLDFR